MLHRNVCNQHMLVIEPPAIRLTNRPITFPNQEVIMALCDAIYCFKGSVESSVTHCARLDLLLALLRMRVVPWLPVRSVSIGATMRLHVGNRTHTRRWIATLVEASYSRLIDEPERIFHTVCILSKELLRTDRLTISVSHRKANIHIETSFMTSLLLPTVIQGITCIYYISIM